MEIEDTFVGRPQSLNTMFLKSGNYKPGVFIHWKNILYEGLYNFLCAVAVLRIFNGWAKSLTNRPEYYLLTYNVK